MEFRIRDHIRFLNARESPKFRSFCVFHILEIMENSIHMSSPAKPETTPGRLEGRVALITGSSSDLGRYIAMAYAWEGAKACCVDLYPEPRYSINPETEKADDFNNQTLGQITLEAPHGLGADAIFVKADLTLAVDIESAFTSYVTNSDAWILWIIMPEFQLRAHTSGLKGFMKPPRKITIRP